MLNDPASRAHKIALKLIAQMIPEIMAETGAGRVEVITGLMGIAMAEMQQEMGREVALDTITMAVADIRRRRLAH